MVYDDLLRLQGSFSCFPQIFLACKKIKKEATNILYGNVEIYFNGVYVHGRRTGQYSPGLLLAPALRSRQTGGPGPDSTTMDWPDFLRRVQLLRIRVPDESKVYPGIEISRGRDNTIGNIIHSLCKMLRQGNNLHAIRVVVQPTATISNDTLRNMLYPLGLLHNIPTEIIDHHDNSLAHFHASSDFPRQTTVSAWPSPYNIVYFCAIATLKLQDGWGRGSTPVEFKGFYRALTSLASAAMLSASSRDNKLPFWMNAVQKSVTQLRIALEEFHVLLSLSPHSPVAAEFLRFVYGLLCVEIQLILSFTEGQPSPQ